MHYLLTALDVPEHVARVIEVEAKLEGATITGHLRRILVDYSKGIAADLAARLTRRDELVKIGAEPAVTEEEL